MIRPHPTVRTGSYRVVEAAPQPDSPAQPTPPPPGVPSPDQKPEIGPMGEPPGVPSPTPGPQRHDDLPHTIDPLGEQRVGQQRVGEQRALSETRRARPSMPLPMRLRPGARPAVNIGRGR